METVKRQAIVRSIFWEGEISVEAIDGDESNALGKALQQANAKRLLNGETLLKKSLFGIGSFSVNWGEVVDNTEKLGKANNNQHLTFNGWICPSCESVNSIRYHTCVVCLRIR